jgi:hypothetical protein
MITTGLSTIITRYDPYFCIGVVLLILFILWVFYGGKKYDFIGLAPLDPVTHTEYTGSLYSWGNQLPSTDQTATIQTENIQTQNVETQNITPIEPLPSLQDISAVEGGPQLNDGSVVSERLVSERLVSEHLVSERLVDTPLYQNVCPHSSPKICVPEDKLLIDETPALPPQFLNKQNRRLPSKGERICCQTMERIYGVSFKSTWPNWLRNPETGAEMELDCFNDDLKIAVEYNGSQHYQWPNFTNQSYQQFMNQVRRDDLKKRICDRNGVYLITVPYNVPYEQIPEYITLYLPETIKNRIDEEHTLQDLSN